MMSVVPETAHRAALAGLVLCGGASTRMGVDKALIELDGEPLVERAVRRLGAVADPVLLACGDRRLAVPGARAVADARAGAGPLAGLVAGLRAAPHELTAVVAVDMPWFDAALLQRMAADWNGEDAVVPWSEDGAEPLHAVYARSALRILEVALDAGRLRLRGAIAELRVRRADAAEAAPGFASNANTPADLLSLRAARRGGG